MALPPCGLWDTFLAYACFLIVSSIGYGPPLFTLFLGFYFGLKVMFAFMIGTVIYSYLESKFHPLGVTGRRWQSFIDLVAMLWRRYEKVKEINVVKLGSYPTNRKYMFCCHPHGMIFLGPTHVFAFNLKKYFPGIRCRMMMSSTVFLTPWMRHFCIWVGGIPSTKEAGVQAIKEGCSIALVPGGLAELMYSDSRPRTLELSLLKKANVSGTEEGDEKSIEKLSHGPVKCVVLYLKARKGFIKMALESGMDLVPVFTFGELQNFNQVQYTLGWRVKLSRLLRFPFVFFYGQKFLSIPFNEPMTVTIGKPIKVEQNKNPNVDAIESLHKEYCLQLMNLFEENKNRNGYNDTRLILI
eukprot:Phypoly_transcript_07893.p1 GENE.Phypoly_transcript_07893~~Phypoly_transcript_07893.p1  ORF type:complete len:374 (+),score=27.51 Phypoly_transcript_07893:63-1124(+)